jgi:uncharacterized membrane protein YqgA involved in biofilm formation
MPGLGTAINVGTIVAGTGVGLLVGGRLPERARATVLNGVGLVVLALGVTEAARTHNIVFPLVSIVLGGLIGEALGIEERHASVGDRIRRRVERDVDPDADLVALEGPERAEARPEPAARSTFVEGFVAASLLFCVGPLAILGSINDGIQGDIQLLAVKSALDGLVSVIFAATLGWGVGFAALPVLVYQGLLTLGAGQADAILTDRMILEGTATGGIMVLGIGLRVLELKPVRVGSLLPALVVAPALVAVFAR